MSNWRLLARIEEFRHGRVPRAVRRRQLVELGEELFLERGFAKASMDELARRAGVTKPVIYELFGSKEGLFNACLEGLALRLADADCRRGRGRGADPESRLSAGGLAFLRFATENRVAYELLYEGRFSEAAATVRRRQATLILELMREMAPDDVDPRELEVAAHAVNSAYEGVAHWMWDHPDIPARDARGLDRRAAPARTTEVHVTHHRVAIVGTGFSGLGMAIRLKQQGDDDFVLLERADDIGGTWRDNTYPGCRCDVPSHLYSFSFAPNPNWSSTFSPQPEILDYLRDCAERFGVAAARALRHRGRDGALGRRRAALADRDLAGAHHGGRPDRCAGSAQDPSLPAVPGLDSFEGTAFHSARWDHDHDLDRRARRGDRHRRLRDPVRARRSSREVEQLHVFQRTAPWVIPHRNRPMKRWERALYRLFPPAQLAMRAGIYWARESFVLQFRHRADREAARAHPDGAPEASQIGDPELRRKLTPDYSIGLQAHPADRTSGIRRSRSPTSRSSTSGLAEVRPHSVVAADGTEREVDTIIFGTGFHVTDVPIADRIERPDGATLAEVWKGSMQAYKGTTVAGFPNLFFLVGPNTGLGHTSIVFMIESQIDYVLGRAPHDAPPRRARRSR